MSLIEMLTAMFVMSFIAAGIAELCVMQNTVGFRTYNKLDALTTARRAASYIEQDIHMARFIGDQASMTGPNTFPAADDAFYSTSGVIDPSIIGFAGFPNATANSTWGAPPYSLGPQTLIVQIPVFTVRLTAQDVAYPTFYQYPAPIPSANNLGFWNVDTVVYQVLADSSKPGSGQFILQKAVFPGEHTALYQPAPPPGSSAPQTIMTGIVGPIDPNGTVDPVAGTPRPEVFSFFSRQYPLYAANSQTVSQSVIDTPTSTDAPNLVGVALTCELTNGLPGARADVIPRSMAFRKEMYVRGNFNSVP